ncbi:hypothetical protein GCM10010483_01560 [Actinokineospora diospyrosa]
MQGGYRAQQGLRLGAARAQRRDPGHQGRQHAVRTQLEVVGGPGAVDRRAEPDRLPDLPHPVLGRGRVTC